MLQEHFFLSEDVITLAQQLLGHKLITTHEGLITSGYIVETEAYRGPDDKACHAYNYRKTQRNRAMYLKGGSAYLYRCYGMHHLLNVVTGPEDIPHAVLIRAILPDQGKELMIQRRQWRDKPPHLLTNGPGKVCQALGISLENNRQRLNTPALYISKEKISGTLTATARIGIDYAQEYRDVPWRFLLSPEDSGKVLS
ncbi:N-methylpurine-DNA glycosylase [Chlamydia pneumoniae TW-183]|uniref:Putative 3-methyladenine DNA glycosylase n=2 Tax=Chlamydia pneumoniae TaxID=83558 RepID=3MGH_CHLPN|nr:DNA-3-methyladenine glycosylase [Chlamydia pneumoniae]Q9Z847.1 RecName: Full=Putative 3-methyladenine DNA glycosylase [Chlamydia pneumoniae]AAD18645.1 3-methyladenine DNA glycosylase [Chlamydia pneumoniae CWL029]AAF38112.1 DNA-3-methyladenine glycosylase [Chlamydia pneumoniae AR39]AAP98455.1 N-methylpurine-DNA glycosylase [Chlamydia pneumoniae TW-183]CRI33016.1 Putative 3-methyladenine DNA glycosylase [Chlamydia pneumoniae]CRI35879.1 Putative 3-methyladenine DNA glycosylase [Chlamydia pneu